MGYKEDMSADFYVEKFGLVSGSASNAFFPNTPAIMAKFVAYAGNIGRFYIGKDGNTTFEITPGTTTEWFPVVEDNLNVLQFRNPSGTVDKLAYWVRN